MNRSIKPLRPFITLLLLTFMSGVAVAQTGPDKMMNGGMMMGGGWMTFACILLGVLILVALVLAILALLKYLFGK